MSTYARYNGDTLMQTARVKQLVGGKYAIETSLFDEKPYECNMNMPMFASKDSAEKWLIDSGKWTLIAE